MKGSLGDKIRIQHILDAIAEIESYLNNVSFKDFTNNSMMRFACIKQIEIIGEASNAISLETKSKFSNIEWKQIIGLRHVLVHEYFGVDNAIIWEIIKTDIPELKVKIKLILDSLD